MVCAECGEIADDRDVGGRGVRYDLPDADDEPALGASSARSALSASSAAADPASSQSTAFEPGTHHVRGIRAVEELECEPQDDF
jgi:hypothetical protein